MPGKFVIKKGSTGKFRFSLVSTNGQIVATSEAYNSKASAMTGIRSVQKLAADAAVEDQTSKEWAAGEEARKATAAAKKAKKSAAKKSAAKKAAAKKSSASS
ncbi:MAG: YegP family protein [Acidimicrobiales bacterium]